MNANQYQSRPVVGFTGSVHQFGGSAGNSGQSGPGVADKKWGDTTSRTGEVSRVFVGSVDYKITNCYEIVQRFQKYGQISGVDINQKNFAFIQYDRVEDAQNACYSENGSNFKGRKIEVRLFDKSGHPTKGKLNRDRSRSPLPRPGGGVRPMGGPTGTRHGSVIPNMNQYEDPYAYGPPPPPTEPVVGNEAEIIVINKDQWAYADVIEKRIKSETGIQFIDMLFLHSPSSLNLTLNDLFERQTLYALVIAPVNEEHHSVTLHVLHNQTEHRNMPLEDALQLIGKDFQAFTGRLAPFPPAAAPKVEQSGTAVDNPYMTSNTDSKLPENISYLLRTILEENGSQFLSITQMDVLIDYFQRQKSSKLVTNQVSSAGSSGQTSQTGQLEVDKQKANLLDNPHVQAALSSLIQIGALNSGNTSTSMTSQPNNQMNIKPNLNTSYPNMSSYGGQQQTNGSTSGGQTLRHPLLGTELSSKPQMAIPGAPGGLVRYPPPQSYNQYNYQF